MVLNPLQPPWHLIYPRGANVTFVTSVIVACALAALGAKRRAAAVAKQKATQSLQFESGDTSPSSHPDAAVALVPPAADAPVDDGLNYAAAKVWGKPGLNCATIRV